MGMIEKGSGQLYVPLANGKPHDLAAKIAAFHLDGSPVPGWPITLMSADQHSAIPSTGYPNWWLSTPAAVDATAKEPATIVIAARTGPGKTDKGVFVIHGDGSITKLNATLASPDPGTTCAIFSCGKDQPLAVVGGGTLIGIDNRPVQSWGTNKLAAGFSGTAADINGDGIPEIFEVTQRHGVSNAVLVAMSLDGKMLPGWPQKVGGKSFAAPSIGNVFGDDKPEVILPDHHGHILAWTFDGKPFGRTFAEAEARPAQGNDKLTPDQAEKEKCTSIFREGINTTGPVALADLDGDGKAEIISIDEGNHGIYAWHGDGTGAWSTDGLIARIGQAGTFGVCACGPDANGAYDFFAGVYWVHRAADGTTQVRNMVQRPATTQPSADVDTVCQDTVCDADGDGIADVLIGTADGRLVIFHTGIVYSSKWAQWPMLAQNNRRDAVWTASTK